MARTLRRATYDLRSCGIRHFGNGRERGVYPAVMYVVKLLALFFRKLPGVFDVIARC